MRGRKNESSLKSRFRDCRFVIPEAIGPDAQSKVNWKLEQGGTSMLCHLGQESGSGDLFSRFKKNFGTVLEDGWDPDQRCDDEGQHYDGRFVELEDITPVDILGNPEEVIWSRDNFFHESMDEETGDDGPILIAGIPLDEYLEMTKGEDPLYFHLDEEFLSEHLISRNGNRAPTPIGSRRIEGISPARHKDARHCRDNKKENRRQWKNRSPFVTYLPGKKPEQKPRVKTKRKDKLPVSVTAAFAYRQHLETQEAHA